ncbi:MAG: A/G-specific adenine glycosylase [Alphaproteobacteria bacterium]
MTGERAARLLAWYDRHCRVLPWRTPPGTGQRTDPYAGGLSEIMLQQSTVGTVGPYFREFLGRWPDVHGLAGADLDEVLTAWAGLGYYARARNLHKCAQVVSEELDGVFPDTEGGLRALPGIGRYTAAAMAAIAFDRPACVVDGNVERVMARLFAVTEPLPAAKGRLYDLADGLTPKQAGGRPGDYAQAVMDLGATVCTPKKPNCLLCPWQEDCLAQARGIAEDLPKRQAKAVRPTRKGVAYWLVRADGAVLLRRRPEKGLLGGMMEVPSNVWHEGDLDRDIAGLSGAPVVADWQRLPGMVRHTFTHFHLELVVMAAGLGSTVEADGVWVLPEGFGGQALPSVMRKVVRHALGHV